MKKFIKNVFDLLAFFPGVIVDFMALFLGVIVRGEKA